MTETRHELVFDLSGLLVRFRGLDDGLARAVASQWAPFVSKARASAWLDVEVAPLDVVIATDRPMRKSIEGEVENGAGWFRSDEGEITIGADGPARVRLGRGDDGWRYWGLVNLISAALAVRLPSRPGALLHAAGIVLDGRAFLLIGPEGAGKSTWARTAREGGAQVISDDAVLVDGIEGELLLLGSPVRSHEASSLGPGRWPVAAVLHARRGSEARLEPVDRLSVEAVVSANLPFLSTAWGRDPRIDSLVPFLATAAPHRALTFAPDPSFVKVLRAATL